MYPVFVLEVLWVFIARCSYADILDDTPARYMDIQVKHLLFKIGANQNFTIPCPGSDESTLVQNLEWFSETKHKKVLEFAKDAGVTVYSDWKDRLTLNSDFSLTFYPTKASDSGDYICLVNHRLMPDVIVRFKVIDVPDPPGRPFVTYFASRIANISWAQPRRTNYGIITHYTVLVRKHLERPDPEDEGGGNDSPEEEMLRKSSRLLKNYTVERLNTTNNDTNFYINHLKPYTIYSFQIIAWNKIGPSLPSKVSYYMVTLRELPSARIGFSVKNHTSGSLLMNWKEPDIEDVNGYFLGYRITWRQQGRPETGEEKFIRNSSVTRHIINNLQPHSPYLISLSVFNPEGHGPESTLLVWTDEGPPSPPRDVTVLGVDDKSISLRWDEPEKTNGHILGYRVYFTYHNYTDQVTDKSNAGQKVIYFNLTSLKPNTEYKIAVKAFTLKHEGELSESIIGVTDLSGPPTPQIHNVSCDYNSTLVVDLGKPNTVLLGQRVESYFIRVYLNGILFDEIRISTKRPYPTAHSHIQYAFQNMTLNTEYEVQVYAVSRSNRTGRLLEGEKSKFYKVLMTEDCKPKGSNGTELWVGIVAGTICVFALFLCSGAGYLLYKKCIQAPYYYLDNTQCTPASLDWNVSPQEETQEDYSGPIAVSKFAEHVALLHADGDIGFSKEYEAIQNDPVNEVNSSENSQHPDNKPKNRYLNIIAYDHSRVQLLPMPSQKISTYINANYIDGFQVNKAYVGTQGPLPSTFDCFWRMIWEQRVTIIVMITNLVERGRRKCDMYWPKEGAEDYGVIQVRLVREDVMATYTIRTLIIRHTRVNVKNKKDAAMAEKTVYQYHYTNWPDHGTPDHPLPVISFVKKSAAANPADSGPIVVHCSAGVGRTGTYIVLDAMLKQIAARGEVNIFGFLKHIRAQRNFLVQTEEQYIFIHDALVEAIEAGETDIEVNEFGSYLNALRNSEISVGNDLWKPIKVQYKQVTSFKPRDFDLVSAVKPVNQPKNRCAVLLPVEKSRVHLTPKPGEDGSDYINASWLPGFTSLREFIITQHPFNKEDFWKMAWDLAVQLVVMLSTVDTVEFHKFWPEGDEVFETDIYTIKQLSVNESGEFVLREFLMKSVQDDYEIRVKFVEAFRWPHQGVPSIKDLFNLPNFVSSLQRVGQGPVCVVDRFGGVEAATFCALVTLKKHLQYEHKVDIYMYAKLYHNKRPGVWLTIDDYMKLHVAVQTLCSTPDKYLAEIPPDMVTMTLANGINGRPKSPVTECLAVSESRSPDGLPSSTVVTIECQPSTSKVAHEIEEKSEVINEVGDAATVGDSIRIPPEETPLIPRNILQMKNFDRIDA